MAETLRNVGGTLRASHFPEIPASLRSTSHIPEFCQYLTGPGELLVASHRLAPTPLRDKNLCIIRARTNSLDERFTLIPLPMKTYCRPS